MTLTIVDHDLGERFWSKVNKSGPAPLMHGIPGRCWVWTGYLDHTGTGRHTANGRKIASYRLSYMWFFGDIPEGLEIDHMCHNRACVNPDHLQAVTRMANKQNTRGSYKNSKSGVRGVSWSKTRGKWRATGRSNGKWEHIGYFADLHSAERAAIAWRRANMANSLMDVV